MNEFFRNNKRAISPVVAIALLLVVSVISVVGFSEWFSEFSSSVFVDVEQDSSGLESVRVDGIVDNKLFLYSHSDIVLSSLFVSSSTGVSNCKIDNFGGNLIGDTNLLLNFDNNSSDSSGYDYNVSLYGGVNCFTTGVSGNGCEFDGVDDGIYLSKIENIKGASMWVKFGDYNGSLLDSFQNAGQGGFSFRVKSSPSELIIHFYENYSIINSLNYNISDLDIWHHVGWSYDLGLKLFINGDIVIKNNVSNYIDNSWLFDGFGLGYRHYNYWNGSTKRTDSNNFLNGSIDEVALYSKPLTDYEIKMLYKSRKALFYEQMLPKGIKSIDVSSCTLNKGEKYDILGFTKSGDKFNTWVIVK